MSLITKIEFIEKSDKRVMLNQSSIDMHDFLTDEADWNDEYWDFYPHKLLQYSKLIEEVINSSSRGIVFQALWAGEKATETIEVFASDFLKIIETNKIKTKAKYVARKNA